MKELNQFEFGIGIIGSRKFDDYNLMKKEVIRIMKETGTWETFQDSIKQKTFLFKIVSGGNRNYIRNQRRFTGADYFAEILSAELFKDNPVVFCPDFEKYPLSKNKGLAYHMRNDEIIENSEIIIAFWDGKSSGTKSVIEKCKKLDKEIYVINF